MSEIPDLEERFEGFAERECGDLHRTVGRRAWCGTDREWCYPHAPCRGCELPRLRAYVAQLQEALREYDRHMFAECDCAAEGDLMKFRHRVLALLPR